MEAALRYELEKIPELKDKIYPTNAPEAESAPYLVYMTRKNRGKTLEGNQNSRTCHVMLNILAGSYEEMNVITRKVENLIETFPLKTIGEEGLYIEDLTFDESTEMYEDQLKLQRGVIPFTVYYKEE